MNKSTTLTLKKPLSILQEAKIYQAIGQWLEQDKKKKQKEEKRESEVYRKKCLWEAVNWLTTTYPKCFNPHKPKPLKIGIDKDIFLKGEWPHSKTFLQKTLVFYLGSPWYQKALLEQHERVSLEGQAIGIVTDHQRAVAEERLKKIMAKKNKPRVFNHMREQRPISSYKQLHHNDPDNQNA